MEFTHAVEIPIRLSQRQTAEQIADELSLPLAQVKTVELILRFRSGRDCEMLCAELGVGEDKVDEICDQFLMAKCKELLGLDNPISDGQLKKLVDLERGRGAVDPKDTDLQSLVKQLFSAESAVKNRVLKVLAGKDKRLEEKLEKNREDDELMALAMEESAENFDELSVPVAKKKSKRSSGGKSSDRFKLLRESGTNGDNYNVHTDEIIQKLETWSTFSKFEVTGAGHDWVELKFSRLPKDLFDFVDAVYKFCPDTVDQNLMSKDALMEDMAQSKVLRLWWD